MHPTRRPMAKHAKTQRGSSPHHVLVSWPRIISFCRPKKGIPLSMSTHVQQNTHILTPLSIDQGIPLPKIQSIPYNFSSARLSRNTSVKLLRVPVFHPKPSALLRLFSIVENGCDIYNCMLVPIGSQAMLNVIFKQYTSS